MINAKIVIGGREKIENINITATKESAFQRKKKNGQVVGAKIGRLKMINKSIIEKLTHEIVEAQIIADDTDKMGWDSYTRANARSYIRGIKKAMAIITDTDCDEV